MSLRYTETIFTNFSVNLLLDSSQHGLLNYTYYVKYYIYYMYYTYYCIILSFMNDFNIGLTGFFFPAPLVKKVCDMTLARNTECAFCMSSKFRVPFILASITAY